MATSDHRLATRLRFDASITWIALGAAAGLTASLGVDLRLALAVVIFARASFGLPAGAVALLSTAVTTFIARGIALSARPDVPTGLVSVTFLVVESVALSHLVHLLVDRSTRRDRPVRRFVVLAGTLTVASMTLAVAEWLGANAIIDESVTSFWERGAAILVASLLALILSLFVSGRRFRIGTMSFDELTAPLAALLVMVVALQGTGEIWRASDHDRLSDGARITMTAFLDAVTADLNSTGSSLGEGTGGPVPESVAVLVARRASGIDDVIVGDGDLVDPLANDVVESTSDTNTDGPQTKLLGDGPIDVDDRRLLLFEWNPQSSSDDTSYWLALDADLLMSDARRSLAGLFDDVEVDLLSPESSDAVTEANVDGARAVGLIDGAELTLVARPGSDFGLDTEGAAIVLLLEVMLGFAVVSVLLIGASSQVRVALERRRRESLLEAALDATPGVSVVFDQDLTVLAGNRTVRDSFGDRIPGIAVTEVLGFGPETVRARITVETLTKVIAGDSSHATVSGGEGDEMRILELEAYPVLVPGDDRVGFLHVADATERRNMAMRTAQAERMESLGALAGGLAHDFNNLLFVTLGNLQLMAMNETISNDEKLAKFLSRSMAAVERGAEITKSLLAVARSQPLEETVVSLADLIKGLLPLVKQAVGAGRTVEVDIPDPNLHLMVDAGRLQSCILNLAFNSRDAMGPNGRIRIAARRRDDVIELSVSDDGAGMPPDVVARAFEPFFTTKKAGSGTGLGLATVYAFAQQSGGTATLDSRPGSGTTVTLVLPLHVPGVTPERTTTARRAGRRVVVADDEQALAEMVAAWLMDVGIDARFALSPREALALISEFRPDVLVSDANFGEEQDGLDLARLATADQPDLAVVFMTGYSSSMKQLQELGERTLAKPFSREDLYGAVLPLVADAVPTTDGGEGEGSRG